MTDDEFLFKIFGEPQAEEALKFPEFGLSRADYLSKLLCEDLHGSEQVTSLMQKGQDFDSQKDVQMVLLLRALLGLDQNEDRSMGEQIGTMQNEFNYAFMERAFWMEDSAHSYRTVHGFRHDYLSLALNEARQYPLQAHRMVLAESEPMLDDDQTFESIAYGHRSGENLAEYLQRRDIERLALADIRDFDASKELAKRLIKEYSILRHQGILRSLTDVPDLCYTVCAAFAPELLKDESLKSDMMQIVRWEAPSRMKFFTSLLYLSMDNVKTVGDMVKGATDEGYGKGPR